MKQAIHKNVSETVAIPKGNAHFGDAFNITFVTECGIYNNSEWGLVISLKICVNSLCL